MGNGRRLLNVILLYVTLLLWGASFLFAQDETKIALIGGADRWELEQMASLRGLAVSGVSDDALRERLLNADGLVVPAATDDSHEETKKGSYTLHVLHANHMRKNSTNSLVTLLGSVSSSFLLSGDSKERVLASDKMLVDLGNTLLSGMGNVTYQDTSDNAAVQKMEGDVITLDWKDSSLSINEGTTETQRKNSDDEEVSFYTTGENITYATKEGGIYFNKGYITNNRQHAYSSITAQKLAMMDNGDMVMQNAYLSIGRVPLLWVPFFFFPGSRMVGNPAIGQESERGWFVNTTFGVYGSDPAITSSSSSSFTRLLETDDPKTVKIKDGPIYRKLKEGEELSPLEQWAKESESYMSILADSYQNSGLAVGVQTENNFWSKKLSIDFDGSLAMTPDGTEEIASYSSYPKTRYFMENSVDLSMDAVKLSLSLPLYSDPLVKRTYANRFTSFSLDHLAGAEWPTDYTSDVTGYTWKANLSFSLPSSWKSGLLDTLTISSAQASAVYTWLSKNSIYAYRLSSVTVPSFTATMGGTLFNFGKKQDTTASAVDQAKDKTGDESYRNRLLSGAYRPENAENASIATSERYIRLSYTLSENFTQSAKSVSNVFDWDETHYLYSLSKGSLVLDTVADPNLLTLKETLTPSFTYTEDQSKTSWKTVNFNVVSNTVASIPVLGMTYTLTDKLYSYSETTTTSGVTTTDEAAFQFTSSYVTTHQIVVSKPMFFGQATVTPSVTYILPPLTQSLTPAISYRSGGLSIGGAFKFIQDDDGILQRNLITVTTKYDGSVLDFTFKNTYQSDDYTADDPWGPFSSVGSLSLSHWGLKFTGSYDFDMQNSSGDYYFNSLAGAMGFGPVESTLTYVGSYDQLEKSTWVTSVDLKNWTLNWWKKRCSLTADINSAMTINFQNPYATNFSISASLQFSIAELLDVKFSVTSSNSGFFTYYEDGVFSWGLMLEDLARSFDIFGSGVHNTQFNMSKLGLEIIHYMDDWTLNCKYTGSVVLSNNKYTWVPVVAVYLQWKTIPELKVDQNWTRKVGDTWSATSSSST